MFNLLVKAGGWSGRRDEVSNSRIYITHEQQPELKPDGVLDLEKLRSLPAIFAGETNSRDPNQTARVGEILSAKQRGDSVALEYRYLEEVPPIPQDELIQLAPALGIEIPRRGFGPFEHSHWAVKEADLFRVLMTEQRPTLRHPTVFRLPQHQTIEQDLLSAMMPFAGFGSVWDAIQRAAAENGMRSGRADITWDHPEIMQDVISLIDRAAIVVCDCTNKNPNVFYEMGIAHALGKEVIIITQNASDVPFDITHLRHIRYLPNGEGVESLAQQLSARIRAIRERA